MKKSRDEVAYILDKELPLANQIVLSSTTHCTIEQHHTYASCTL